MLHSRCSAERLLRQPSSVSSYLQSAMLTSEQIRGARAMLRIEQRELAEMAEVSLETVKRIERSPGPISALAATVDKLQRALEAGGVEFTNGGEPGVKLKAKSRTIDAEDLNVSNDK